MTVSFEKINLAHKLLTSNKPAEALEVLKSLGPKAAADADACAISADSCILLRDYPRALFHAQRAVALRPRSGTLLCLLSTALSANRKYPEAEAALKKAIQIEPGLIHARVHLACDALREGKVGEAMAHFEAIKSQPWSAHVCGQYGSTLASLCRPDDATRFLEESAAKFPNSDTLLDLLCAISNYSEDATIKSIARAHMRYGDLLTRLKPPHVFTHKGSKDPERKLRVGLVSDDFRSHSVSFFIASLFERYDHDKFELYGYSLTRHPDEVSNRLAALATKWQTCPEDIDIEIARKVEADGIDILIDLSGHTCGSQMTLLCYKPAPVQATYCGYPNTTGVNEVDWRIVDSITDPPKAAWTPPANEPDAPDFDERCSERLFRLDPCFLCYTPPPNAPPPRPPRQVDSSAPIVFGSFNASRKISRKALELWRAALKASPGSTLALKSMEFGSKEVLDHLRKSMAELNIDLDRVTFLEPTKAYVDHLQAYYTVDIALDTSPYNGTTTTCEALWMGVPVITMLGDTHAARVGGSLLNALGHNELVANSPEQYSALAAALAADPKRLHDLHAGLRAGMEGSVLRDAEAYTRRFEAALRAMWAEHCGKAG